MKGLLAFGGVSVLMLGLSLFLILNTRSFLNNAETARGEVIDLMSSYDDEGDVTYAPIVTYTTLEGKTLIHVGSNYSYPAAYDKGEIIDVYYNPEEPKDVRLPRFFSLWGGALITGILGLLFGGATVLIIFWTRTPKEQVTA